MAKCELRNKRAREDVAKGYYDVSFLSFCFVYLDGSVGKCEFP